MLRVHLDHQIRVHPQHRLEHRHEVGNHLGRIENDRLQHLAPCEGQELASDPACAIGVEDDLIEVGSGWMVVGQVAAGELGMAADRCQEIVEVVRDSKVCFPVTSLTFNIVPAKTPSLVLIGLPAIRPRSSPPSSRRSDTSIRSPVTDRCRARNASTTGQTEASK